ncbi:MAG: DUF2785 domain-containing protein [Myxococcales bacterium]|nr:DUF2785 domain-containing protein [Myxococcales bacterium]
MSISRLILAAVASALLALGCRQPPPACPAAAATPAGAVAPAPASTAPTSPLTSERRAWWRAIRGGGALPDGTTAASLVPELEALLAASDPEVRDGIGYEVLARWLGADAALDDATVAGLRDRLVARTAAAPTPGDAVFGRSFAALVSSVIVAREVAAPRWSDAEVAAQIDAATAYAAREVDLRGYTGATGWAHAAAHAADWMKFLARHPRLQAAQATQLLGGVAALVARGHGARFSHGEDERLAAAVRAVARRDLLDDAAADAWLAAVAAPLASGWPDPFDPVVYATQRNARDLLVSCFIALSFDDSPGAARLRARLERAMRGG